MQPGLSNSRPQPRFFPKISVYLEHGSEVLASDLQDGLVHVDLLVVHQKSTKRTGCHIYFVPFSYLNTKMCPISFDQFLCNTHYIGTNEQDFLDTQYL